VVHALRARGYVLAAIGAVLIAASVSDRCLPRPRTRASSRPNVLILAADSLRPDRLVPAVAPRLAALADEGATFDASYTSLPRTFPAWVTRLTGQYPHHHGFRNMFPGRDVRARALDALPERLTAAGYATSVAADYAGDVFPRAAFGFERIDTPTFHFGELVRQRVIEPQIALWPLLASRLGRVLAPSVRGMNRAPDADDVAARTLAAVDAAGDRPFFHVAFFSTAHFPYAAPWPGYARFTRPEYRGRFKYDKANVLGREAPPDDADVAQVRALYDGAVTTIDDAAGRVLDGLARRGRGRDTIVIVTADHGETLFEAGRGHGHGDHLFGDEALHVPLVVYDGRAPARRRVTGFARDVDLAPTIYDLTGVPAPPGLDGTSLVPGLATGATGVDAAFAETGLWFTEDAVPADVRIPYPDVSRMLEVRREDGDDVVLQERWRALTTMAKHRAIVTDAHELVLAPTRAGLRTLLFDRVHDPACMVDLSAREPELAGKLRARLLGWVLEDRDLELSGEHLVWRHRRDAKTDASTAVRLEEPR
jgi:arylsulfatase A-like enzyme